MKKKILIKKQLTDEINNIDQTASFLKDQIRDKELIKKMKRLREQLKLNKNISMEDENLINSLLNQNNLIIFNQALIYLINLLQINKIFESLKKECEYYNSYKKPTNYCG